ncbi:MAG: HlyD family efflux transporter periplasmic adaptor subunit [Eubacteriales bacterium]|nr:HlyD family efflux transporter periplasmic adaptor subunit [Eubacteriales bacterium]
MKKKILLAALSLMLSVVLMGSAAAETTFDGTVVSSESVSVTAPFGGTVSSFRLREGDEISVGDVIAEVETTKVYASTNGVVTGVFGQPGDAVDDVVSRVGAVLYIEPDSKYTITADIQKAYSDSDNKYVNIGETVYIESYYSSNGNTAVGTITATSGTTYTVETTSGELLMEETVNLYRSSDYASTSRIGRGTVSRTAEVAVSGSGSILYMHVKDGDAVTRGQLLFETVTGTLDGLYATSNQIVSDVDGIIASVNLSAGSTINKGDTLLTVYPRDEMQVVIEIDEYDLADIHEGDQILLEFNYDDSDDSMCPGTVSMISHVSASSGTSDVAYKAYIDFTPNDDIRLGMTVLVSTENGTDDEEYMDDTEDGSEITPDLAAAPDGAETPTEDVLEAATD